MNIYQNAEKQLSDALSSIEPKEVTPGNITPQNPTGQLNHGQGSYSRVLREFAGEGVQRQAAALKKLSYKELSGLSAAIAELMTAKRSERITEILSMMRADGLDPAQLAELEPRNMRRYSSL